MAFADPEDGFYDGGQLAQEGRLPHPRKLDRIDDLLKERPQFLTRHVALGIGRKVFLNEPADGALEWHWGALLRLVNQGAEQRDDAANGLKLSVCHTP